MNLPGYLFWDTDINTIDYNKNARFIIQRVIQRGSIDDWLMIKKYYGIDMIKNEIVLMRDLDPKTLNFFSTYFGINKNNFRCYSIQRSIPQHFNY